MGESSGKSSIALLLFRLTAFAAAIGPAAAAIGPAAAAVGPAKPAAAIARDAVAADLARQIGGARLRVEIRRFSASGDLFEIAGGAPFGADPFAPAGPSSDLGRDPMKIDAMDALARAFAARLSSVDPAGASVYAAGLARFQASSDALRGRLARLARLYRGSTVFLADPLGLPLAAALRFEVRDRAAADPKPPPGAIDALSEDIGERKAAILIYDAQSKTAAAAKLVQLAEDAGVPAVGLRETLPSALTWQQWKLRETAAVNGALNEAAP